MDFSCVSSFITGTFLSAPFCLKWRFSSRVSCSPLDLNMVLYSVRLAAYVVEWSQCPVAIREVRVRFPAYAIFGSCLFRQILFFFLSFSFFLERRSRGLLEVGAKSLATAETREMAGSREEGESAIERELRENAQRLEQLYQLKKLRGGLSASEQEKALLLEATTSLGRTLEEAGAGPWALMAEDSPLAVAESAATNLGMLPDKTRERWTKEQKGHKQSQGASSNEGSMSVIPPQLHRHLHFHEVGATMEESRREKRAEAKGQNIREVKPEPPRKLVRRCQEGNVKLEGELEAPPAGSALRPERDVKFYQRAHVKDMDEDRWFLLDVQKRERGVGFNLGKFNEQQSAFEISYSTIYSIYEGPDGTAWAEHKDFYDFDDVQRQAMSLHKGYKHLIINGNEPIPNELFRVCGRRHTPLANAESALLIYPKRQFDQLRANGQLGPSDAQDVFIWRLELDPSSMRRVEPQED